MRQPKPGVFEAVEGAPPDFLHELYDEVRAFFETLAGFTRHPIAFCREWSEGRRRAMNPVGFFGVAVGVQLAAAAILAHLRPGAVSDEDEALRKLTPEFFWVLDLLSSQLPLAKAAIFAFIVHRRLVKKGSSQTFRGSLGAVLFAQGWEALGRALAAMLALAFGKEPGGAAGTAIGIAALVMLALALAGVHRLKKRRAAIGPMALGGLGVAAAASLASAVFWGPVVKKAIQNNDKVQLNRGGTGVRVIDLRSHPDAGTD